MRIAFFKRLHTLARQLIGPLVFGVARVTLYPDRPIRPGDLAPPALVDRNQIVTLEYAAGPLVILTEGRALADRLFGPSHRPVDLRRVPSAVFMLPPLASVGPVTEPCLVDGDIIVSGNVADPDTLGVGDSITAGLGLASRVALPMALNIPFRRIGSASVARQGNDTADIPLVLTGPDRISYLHLWPHVRPWLLRQPQPALRAIPDAARVARLLADAAQAKLNEPRIEARAAGALVAAE